MAPRLPLDELAQLADAISHPNRLRLLEQLRTPKVVSEIELPASTASKWGPQDRTISAQAVRDHLKQLVEIGIVDVADPDERGTPRYVVNHARLFLAGERLRQIAILRPATPTGGDTLEHDDEMPALDAPSPSITIIHGVDEGRYYRLSPGQAEGLWRIGRGSHVDVRIEHDLYVSREHATLLRKADDFFVSDLGKNKNGTWLNGRRIAVDAWAPLRTGDLVGVGLSRLLVRL